MTCIWINIKDPKKEKKVNIPLTNVTKGKPKKERKKEKGDGEYVEMDPDKGRSCSRSSSC